MCKPHTRYQLWHLSIVDASSREVAYKDAKQQNIRCTASSLNFFGMEVWNGRFLVWNGRKLLVWNMEKLSSIPFQAMPCRQHKSNKIAYKVNLLVFLKTKYN